MSAPGLQSPVLLIQCCHLPQFLYIAKKLQEENPQLEIHAMVADHPDVQHFLDRFGIFERVHVAPGLSGELNSYSDILFPLLNRGYTGLKRRAWRLRGRRWYCGYEGQLAPLAGSRLTASFVFSPGRSDLPFKEFLGTFPQLPLGEKILLVNSAHDSLNAICGQPLQDLLSGAESLTTLKPGSFWKAGRKLKGKSFDGAIVFFSGEPGFFHLKICPS